MAHRIHHHLETLGDLFRAVRASPSRPELITSGAEEYEALAVELAGLVQLRERLRLNRLTAPLFDIDAYTRHLGAAYTQMYERCHGGLPPEDMRIQAGEGYRRHPGPTVSVTC